MASGAVHGGRVEEAEKRERRTGCTDKEGMEEV
jgi:hypothetical protein